MTSLTLHAFLLCLSAAALFVVNTVPVAIIISLTKAQNPLKVWENIFELSFPYFVLSAAVAALVLLASQQIGWPVSLLVLPIMFGVFTSYKRYFQSELTSASAPLAKAVGVVENQSLTCIRCGDCGEGPCIWESPSTPNRLKKIVSGVLYRDQHGTITGVNSFHHPERQRFPITIAHEIGHFVLHEIDVQVDKGCRMIFRNTKSSRADDPLEIAANGFAAELLMPPHMLPSEVENFIHDFRDEAGLRSLALWGRMAAHSTVASSSITC